MTERTVKGTIAAWTKEVNEKEAPTGNYYSLGLKMQDEDGWHNIVGEHKEPLEKLKEGNPVGSEVEFIEWQKEGSNFWNFKAGSWILNKKGEGYKGGKSYGYRPSKEEYWKQQRLITRQTALKAAVELAPKGVDNPKLSDVLLMAEDMHNWINKEE